MTEFVITSILWAFISFSAPQWESVQVLDEFPTDQICVGVAKELATEVKKDMIEKKITNADVTLACINILEIKNPQNVNGSGLIPKPRSKSNGEWIG